MSTFLATKLTVNVSLTAPAIVSAGIGALAVLAPRGAVPLSGDLTTVSSAADVAALLAATNITADGAAQLTAAFAQGISPGVVYVATYAADIDDAADVIEAAGVPVGVLVPAVASDAALHLLGDWRGTGTRAGRYVVVSESRNADLLTSGKPAALDGCEQSGWRMLYGASALGSAGAYGGRVASINLATGKLNPELRLLGINAFDGTSAQGTFARANDAGTLLNLDVGTGASQRIVRGVTGYDGVDFGASVGIVYVAKRCESALAALFLALAQSGRPLDTSVKGRALLDGTVRGVLESLAAVWFEPREDLPLGYSTAISITGADYTVDVTVAIAGVADNITINLNGEVV